jgi:hypothetical protein
MKKVGKETQDKQVVVLTLDDLKHVRGGDGTLIGPVTKSRKQTI